MIESSVAIFGIKPVRLENKELRKLLDNNMSFVLVVVFFTLHQRRGCRNK